MIILNFVLVNCNRGNLVDAGYLGAVNVIFTSSEFLHMTFNVFSELYYFILASFLVASPRD